MVSAVQLTVPPLMEWVEGFPELAQNLLGRLTADWGREPVAFSRSALALLQRHLWPGNIRELRNVLERALLGARESVIEAPDLDFASSPRREPVDTYSGMTLKEMERHHVAQVLAEEGGHVERAAKRLDIPRSTLYQKVKLYGLESSR